MGVPYVTTFCCCISLEVGTRCVGFLHLLAGLSLTILSALFTSDMHAYVGTIEDAGDGLYSKWFIIGLVVTVISLVHVIFAVILLIGVFKHTAVLVRVWVWAMLALSAAALLYVVAAAALGFTETGSDIFVAFVEGVIFFGVLAYCILTVNSFYLMLKSSQDMEGPKTDY